MLPAAHLLPDKAIRHLIRPYRAIGGFLTESEAVALFRASNRLPARAQVVEIGSWKGKSTFCLARGLRSGGMLHAIDPFDAAGEPGSAEVYAQARGEDSLLDQFHANTSAVRTSITVHRGYSREFTSGFPRIDLLMIDGDHSVAGCRFDFENFGPAVVSGGWIAFHDYYPGRADLGPTWVVENLVKPGGQYTNFAGADSLWLAQRK